MSKLTQSIRILFSMEVIGLLILGIGLSFACASIGLAFDDERAKAKKPEIDEQVQEMRLKLVAANVGEDQMDGLLSVHRSALIANAVLLHLGISAFLFLFSLLVSLFGSSLVLFAKLKGRINSVSLIQKQQ
jgi:hypothetical protein